MVNVTTECLLDISEGLNASANSLLQASERARGFVNMAGYALEGAQYSLTVSETDAACRVMEESAESMFSLSDYIDELCSYIESYLGCTYNGN